MVFKKAQRAFAANEYLVGDSTPRGKKLGTLWDVDDSTEIQIPLRSIKTSFIGQRKPISSHTNSPLTTCKTIDLRNEDDE